MIRDRLVFRVSGLPLGSVPRWFLDITILVISYFNIDTKIRKGELDNLGQLGSKRD